MHLTFRSKAAESSGYRPDIDGLRAVAVLSVVLFHAGIRGFSGGFVGVDVFFVISGYLITGVIEAEIARERFSFRAFYVRRMRRIFPALFTVALVCTAMGAVLYPPQQFVDYGWSLLALTGFVSNVYFKTVSFGAGYFADLAGTRMLLHTWSLSVEEQYYVLFPMALVLLNRFAKGYKKPLLVLIAVVSFGLSVWGVRHSTLAAFYLLPGRAWELLVGALLAMRILPPIRNGYARLLVGGAGLGAIIYAVTMFTEGIPFPGPHALYPCIGAALLIYAGEEGPSLVKSVMAFRPLVFVGIISYSLYLWHWPMIALAKYYYATPWVRPQQMVIPLVLSGVLGFLSFEFLESPFRKRRGGEREEQRTFLTGIGASVMLAAVAVVLVMSGGLPKRFHPEKTARMTQNYAEKAEIGTLPQSCNNWETDVRSYSDVDFCEFGHAKKNILFWGDSHAAQLAPLAEELQAKDEWHGRGLVFAVSGGCPPSTHFNVAQPNYHCDAFTRFAMMRAEKDDIDTVFLAFSPWWSWITGSVCEVKDGHCMKGLSGAEAVTEILAELSADFLELKKMGKRVIVSLPFPYYGILIPDYEIRNLALGRFARYGGGPIELSPINLREGLKAIAARDGVEVYDPRETLCPQVPCRLAVDGVSLYSDHSHLAHDKLWVIEDGLRKSLQARP